MKKLITSKPFIAGSLGVLCVAILAVCLLWGNDKHLFVIDDPVSLNAIESWTENPSSPAGTAEKASVSPVWQSTNSQAWQPSGGQPWQPSNSQPVNPVGEFPKIAEESSDEVVIHFTDPAPYKEPAPATQGTDPNNAPAQSSSSAHEQRSSPPPTTSSGTPAPGSKNASCEVYDPVFGWVKPGIVIQTEIDSDGDINKMVGSMN